MNRVFRLLLLWALALVGSSAAPVGAATSYGWVRVEGRPVAWNSSQPVSIGMTPAALLSRDLTGVDLAALLGSLVPGASPVSVPADRSVVPSLSGGNPGRVVIPGPAPIALSGRADPWLVFHADRRLLGALLADPARIGSTAAPILTDLAVTPPRLNNLIVSNVTDSGASVSFVSDVATNTVVYTASPLTEISSPALTTTHQQTLTGLAAGTGYRLRAAAVSADLGLAALPEVVFTTAQPVQPALGTPGAALISAGAANVIVDPADPNAVFEVLSFRNIGSGDASDVTITSLSAPAGWSFTTPLLMPLDLGALGHGASGVIVTRLQTAAVVAGSPPPLLAGAGSVTTSGQAPQPFTIGGTVPALYLTKSVAPASAQPGDTVTFTLTVTNEGLAVTTGVSVSDILPAGLTFVSASSGGQPQNGAVVWPPGSLASGTSASLTLQAQVAAGATPGTTITNVVQASSVQIPNPVASSGAVVTVLAPPPPPVTLQLSKTADRTTVMAGDVINYTLTYQNAGSAPASNVLMSDPLPPGTIQPSAPGGVLTSSGGVTAIVWALGSLPPGASSFRTLQLRVAPGTPGGTTITNTAQITARETTAPVTATAAAVQVVAPPPAPPVLQLVKQANVSTVQTGQSISYTITATNVGGGAATNVQITDTIPGGTTYVSNSASNGGGPISPTALGWTLGSLQPGASATVTFQVQAVASSGTINNTAQVQSAEITTPVASNTVSVNLTAPPAPPVLQLVKQANVSTVQPGQSISYTITATNVGSGAATNVQITDTIPGGTTYVPNSASNGGGPISATAVGWTFGSLQPGGSATVSFQVQAVASSGAVNNVAQVQSAEITTPVPSNQGNPVVVNIVSLPPPPLLSVLKEADVTSAQPGGIVNYRLTVSNNGGGPATNVTVSDPIPSGLTALFALDGGSINPGSFGGPATATWNVGTLVPGAARQVHLQVRVNSNVSGVITNTAQAMSVEAATPVNSNGVSVTVSAPPPPPQLTLAKQANVSSAQPGQSIRYTITASNVGGGAATNVQITDTIPGGTTYVPNSASSGGGPISATAVGWTFSALQPGTSATVSFQVQVVAASGAINNVAQVQSAEITTPIPSNQGNPVVVNIVSPPQLQIQKQIVGSASVAPQGVITYQLIYSNAAGAGTATGVTIQDTLPLNTSFVVPNSSGGAVSGVTMVWNVGTVAPGQSGSVTLQVRVNPGVANGTPINNTARISSNEVQTPVSSNTVTSTVVVAPPPALTLSKAVDKASAMPGDTLTYTLSFANTGGQAANPAVILDQLPPGVTFVPSPNGGQLVNATPPNTGLFVRFDLGTLAPGASGSVQFTAKINTGVAAGTQIANTAAINTPGLSQPVVSNTVTTTVAAAPPPPPSLTLSKAVDKSTAAPGDTLTYTLEFANTGSQAASQAVIVDQLPPGVSFGMASNGGQPVNATPPSTGLFVRFNLGTLAPGAGGSVQFTAKVSNGVAAGTQIANTAAITASGLSQPVVSNTVITTVTAAPPPTGLTLSKSVDKMSAVAGDTLSYTLNFANGGSQVIHQVTITDPVPTGATFSDAPGGQFNAGTVSYAIGDLAPNKSGHVTLLVKVNPGLADGTMITNQAQITGQGVEQPISSNSVSTSVTAPMGSFTGTWTAIPSTGNAVSLTVDPQNRFTVWAVSADRQTVERAAQGHLDPDGSFDVLSTDNLVHFTGKIAADRQSATITAQRQGGAAFTVTAARAPDVPGVNPLPNGLVGTFNGSGSAPDGSELRVRFSTDPGGNTTLEAEVIPENSATTLLQFAHLYATPDGRLTDPASNRQVGVLNPNTHVLMYSFVSAAAGYQNTFTLTVQPLP